MLQFVATMTRSATAPEHAHLFFIFSLLSGFFWTCAYALAIRNGFKYKTYCIPAPAVCMNLAWELLGALELSGYAPVWVWLCRLAVILDTVIFLTVILYGARSQGPWLGHETIFRALMVLGFLITFGVQYLHVHSLHGYLQYLPSDSELMRKIGDVLQANDDLPGHIKATLARIQSMAGTYVINLLMSLMFLTWLFAQRKPFERGMEGQFGLGV
ncbi:MAG TPA: hypothetical protein VEU33_33315, partial [Archangium sp.]|nr:hypothetical protein [Archangium sp.]